MKTIALVGKSGTGKSYRAIMVARENNIEYIIDDGLLINGTKILAGKSAKRESSTIAAVKRALFMGEEHKDEVRRAIIKENPESVLILGTSNKMVRNIASNLGLPEISKIVNIEDISNEEDINIARNYRKKEGKHVIPVPTFEVKKDFSGYFIDTLKIFQKKEELKESVYEKTVVRPTFSYLGKYRISLRVVKDLTKHAANKVLGISKISNIYIKNYDQGVTIYIDIEVVYGNPIIPVVKLLQEQVIYEVEQMTALNILSVDVYVKKMIKL